MIKSSTPKKNRCYFFFMRERYWNLINWSAELQMSIYIDDKFQPRIFSSRGIVIGTSHSI